MTSLSRFLRPPTRRSSARPSVALGGLALALLAGLGSCIVPQNVDPINTRVHPPPRIVIESLDQAQFVPFLTLTRAPRDVGCTCKVTLNVPAVAEDDPTVALQARWFVDYDVRVPVSLKLFTFKDLNGSFDFTLLRRVGPSYPFSADDLGGDGFHSVEVVIAEADAYLASDDAQAKLPFRSVKNGYESASYRFFVRVVTDPDAPRCSEQAPLTRVCTGSNP